MTVVVILHIIVLMKIDTNNLKTFANFGKSKNISRQRIYRLVEAGRFDTIEIDGCKFIVMNDKALKYKKQISFIQAK